MVLKWYKIAPKCDGTHLDAKQPKMFYNQKLNVTKLNCLYLEWNKIFEESVGLWLKIAEGMQNWKKEYRKPGGV